MASRVASKRVPLVRALEKILAASCAPGARSSIRPVALTGGLRGYNTGEKLRRYDEDESDGIKFPDYTAWLKDGYDKPPRVFSEVFFDPNDYLMDAPPKLLPSDANEDEEGLHLRVFMGALSKERMKLWTGLDRLNIEYGEGRRRAVDIPWYVYRNDKIKAELKNCVLKVDVPKIKEEDREEYTKNSLLVIYEIKIN